MKHENHDENTSREGLDMLPQMRQADIMHMVVVMENDTWELMNERYRNSPRHVAIWRGRASSSGHFVMMSK